MKQAHRAGLVFGRTGFDKGADDDFDQSASDGIDEDRNQNAGIRIAHPERKHPETAKPQSRKKMGADDAFAVTEIIDKACRQKVDKKLYGKIDHDKKRYLTIGKTESVLHRQKQQRHKIIDDCLNKVADIARIEGVFEIAFDRHLIKDISLSCITQPFYSAIILTHKLVFCKFISERSFVTEPQQTIYFLNKC